MFEGKNSLPGDGFYFLKALRVHPVTGMVFLQTMRGRVS